MTRSTYTTLPLFAREAIDRLQMNHALRTHDHLNALLDAYATTTGAACTAQLRKQVYAVASRRFLMPLTPVVMA